MADEQGSSPQIELGADLIRHIRSGEFLNDRRESPGTGVSTEVHPKRRRRIGDLECEDQEKVARPAARKHREPQKTRPSPLFLVSERDAAFVEAVVVLVLHKQQTGELDREGVVKMTNQQIRNVAGDRHPEVPWVSDVQIEREMKRFLGRPGDGKNATVFEWLREVRKGERTRGKRVGTLSEYEPTGIALLLNRALGRPSLVAA